jgi:hypothetical protein
MEPPLPDVEAPDFKSSTPLSVVVEAPVCSLMNPLEPPAACPDERVKEPLVPLAVWPAENKKSPESPADKDSPDESVTDPECFVAVVEIPDCKTNEPEFESEFPLFNSNNPLL